jgi:hypothetical protein
MKQNKKKSVLAALILSGLVLFMQSCEKPEKPYILTAAALTEKVDQVSVGEANGNTQQIFYSLTNGIVSVKNMRLWDIAFTNDSNISTIYINGGKGMLVYNTRSSQFATPFIPPSSSDPNWKFDASNGSKDSTAFGTWLNTTTNASKKDVYIIDRGPLYTGPDKYLKFQILSRSDEPIIFLTSSLSPSAPVIHTELKKDTIFDRTYFSFETQKQILIEPLKNTWDIQFTRYKTIAFDASFNLYLPYIVTGALTNSPTIKATIYTQKPYSQITLADATALAFNNNADNIGWDWKTYNIASAIYTIPANKSYIIQLSSEQYYKFRFIDYYNSTGTSGYPKFEFVRL